ncbi:MAG: glycoside hydrolase family 92 protein, partial [Clostridia bacterium]|nr:glycoside hydrolase family 92 protein [Clostridia bacterium]
QQYTREVLRHVYVGSEIGQGFPGDEDNGEMSAWYIFNALGFYPYALASGEYMIGSPLFDKVTVHFDNGNDLVIEAHNNSRDNVYIQSATVNGKAYDKLYLTHEMITGGCSIVYEMGSEPSSFGTAESSRPSSFSTVSELDQPVGDLAENTLFTVSASTSTTNCSKLLDNNSLTSTTVADGTQITLSGGVPSKVSVITLSDYAASTAPTGVLIEASNDGFSYKKLAEAEISFLFDKYVLPVSIPESLRGFYNYYRVTLYGGTKLAEIEFLGETGSEVSTLANDVNGDGELSIIDVTALLDFLSLSKIEQAQFDLGIYDIDFSGSVTINDVTYLLNKLSGM